MPLPQQVIEQLGREPVKTPGWSSGILFFSGTILGIMVAIYVGLAFGYVPYLNNAIAQSKANVTSLNQSITSADQEKLVTYYSQISNLQSLVGQHVIFSNFLTWLENNTEANVYYGSMNFVPPNEITLSVLAETQADVNQQIGIFESASEVNAVSVSNISFSPAQGMWIFSVTLTMQPSLFEWQSSASTTLETNSIATTTMMDVATTTTSGTTTTP